MLGGFCCQDFLFKNCILDSVRYGQGAIFCYQDLLIVVGLLDFFMYWQGAII